jgi:hypothetical protein
MKISEFAIADWHTFKIRGFTIAECAKALIDLRRVSDPDPYSIGPLDPDP